MSFMNAVSISCTCKAPCARCTDQTRTGPDRTMKYFGPWGGGGRGVGNHRPPCQPAFASHGERRSAFLKCISVLQMPCRRPSCFMQ